MRVTARAWLEVDLGALVRNAQRYAAAAAVPMLPMVKADAYGLGAVSVAKALLPLGVWGFGVATIEEGEELRASGIEKPILVFSPLLARQLEDARAAGLRPVLGEARAIEKAAQLGLTWHLAIDTGMNRAGIPWRDVASYRPLLELNPPEGVCTHFHSAQSPDGSRETQENRFAQCVSELPARPSLLHADNSPAVEHRAPSPFNLARPGIFLYGVSSGRGARIMPDPVVAVRGRVVEVREVKAGDTVGYDGGWEARRDSRIATVSLGYADGYRRGLGNKSEALVNGQRTPVVGFVTMDMTMLDVTNRSCAVGDVVTFIGSAGGASITIAEVANWGWFSPYEILTGLRGRLARQYVGGE